MFSMEALEQLADLLAPMIAKKITATTKLGITPRLLTPEQAGVYIGREENAVRVMMSRKKLPIIKPDGRAHLDVRDLDRWIDVNRQS